MIGLLYFTPAASHLSWSAAANPAAEGETLRLRSGRPRTWEHEATKQPVRILDAAKIVFLRDGGAKFSARRVAREAKVGLSTVQHFFSTTDELQIAMLRYVDRIHEEIYRNRGAKLPFGGVARLHAVLDFLIEDVFKSETRRFYFGFRSQSCHNKRAEKFLAESYANHRDTLAVFIGAARPTLSEERCRELATQIAAMIEGLMVYIPAHGKGFPNRKKLVRSVKQTIWTLISSQPEAEAEALV
jgi:AcrR family transcriptional regulator